MPAMTPTDEPPNRDAGPVPLAWPSLAFHPLGLYDLRRRLGKLPKEPGIYNTYIDHFKYSDIAWFAPGLSKKTSVETSRNSFLPEYLALRSALPKNSTATEQRTALRKQLQALTFDSVCHFLWFYNVTLNHSLVLTRRPFGTELLVGQLWLSMLKAQLDLGLLASQNISKPMFTFQAIWSVRSHTLRLLSPTLSSGLFVILGFRPSSVLIDAYDYFGTRPPILAQSRLHILCKPPHPLPRLQAPACSPIMGSRIEPQCLIST